MNVADVLNEECCISPRLFIEMLEVRNVVLEKSLADW